MEVHVGDIAMAGDIAVDIDLLSEKGKIIIGPGLRVFGNKVQVTKCGILHQKKPNTFWINSLQKRYVPAKGETVVGIVTNRLGDIFKVDIGSSEQAQLPFLAFEGATKKHRPNVNVGDVICAKLLVANRDMEPELVCVDSHGKQGKLGVLSNDGFLFTCSLNLVRKILNPKCILLDSLHKYLQLAFEIAIGMNGFIWLKANTMKETVAVANLILAAEFKNQEDIKHYCEDIGKTLSGF